MVLLFMPFFCLVASAGRLGTAAIFGDNMVIQRDIHTPVWGYGTPGDTVWVDFAGFRTPALVLADNSWIAKMPVLQAGGPYTMVISTHSDTIVFNNVMVGEVWLASGQSNMEWTVGAGVGPDTEREISTGDFPGIRFYNVPRKTSIVPLKDTEPNHWLEVNTETIKNLSAVAYFFARDLHLDKDVAIGIISSSWGATSAHAWISNEMLSTHPDFVQTLKDRYTEPTQWDSVVAQSHWNDMSRDSIAASLNEGLKQGVHKEDYNDGNWKDVEYPVDMRKAQMPGFWGVSWFRKSFDIPAEQRGKSAVIRLYIRARETTFYLNGREIGKFSDTEGEIELNIRRGILKPGKNVLAIRMYQHWGIGRIGTVTSVPVIETNHNSYNQELDGTWRSSGRLEPPVPGMQGYYNYYSVQYNARIAPLIPYSIRGAIWYQGEGNITRAYQYRSLFPLLIQDWRTRWGLGYFPFLFVQLANHRDKQLIPADDEFAELREAQTLALRYPNTGMAVAIDIGDALDIHPRNKLDVGRRLYLAARKIAYNEDIVHTGPVYEKMEIEENRIRIFFSNAENGLFTSDGKEVRGFAIAGADGKFFWAEAAIEGNTVLVSSMDVLHPVEVRYAWEANPGVNLYNTEGLPALPFRSDNHKLSTE
jgi:sialate O-acetylesterase